MIESVPFLEFLFLKAGLRACDVKVVALHEIPKRPADGDTFWAERPFEKPFKWSKILLDRLSILARANFKNLNVIGRTIRNPKITQRNVTDED